MSQYSQEDHTFVVLAYKVSPYLEECICSLLEQTVKTRIYIATSTPNEHICTLAEKYQLPLFVNSGETGIAGDWNFACSCVKTSLFTLAHQDDRYENDYVKSVLTALNHCKHPLIVFSDYLEIREEQTVTKSTLLTVKRWMLSPLKLKMFWKNRYVRRRILSLGNAICCPSVTFIRDHLTFPLFTNNMKSNIDWQTWEQLSKLKGEFAYIDSVQMQHRIHEASTTSELLEVNGREEEDLFMFRKFWPEKIARVINRLYHSNEKLNRVE